jgi:hypothetical protein
MPILSTFKETKLLSFSDQSAVESASCSSRFSVLQHFPPDHTETDLQFYSVEPVTFGVIYHMLGSTNYSPQI